jgi:hypothetical protein
MVLGQCRSDAEPSVLLSPSLSKIRRQLGLGRKAGFQASSHQGRSVESLHLKSYDLAA